MFFGKHHKHTAKPTLPQLRCRFLRCFFVRVSLKAFLEKPTGTAFAVPVRFFYVAFRIHIGIQSKVIIAVSRINRSPP